MNTTISRRLVRIFAGPVAVAGIIGGAMGMAAIANASTAPMVTPAQPVVASHAVQQPIVARHAMQAPASNDVSRSSRAVQTAPWPPNNRVVSSSTPLLGARASHMLGDR